MTNVLLQNTPVGGSGHHAIALRSSPASLRRATWPWLGTLGADQVSRQPGSERSSGCFADAGYHAGEPFPGKREVSTHSGAFLGRRHRAGEIFPDTGAHGSQAYPGVSFPGVRGVHEEPSHSTLTDATMHRQSALFGKAAQVSSTSCRTIFPESWRRTLIQCLQNCSTFLSIQSRICGVSSGSQRSRGNEEGMHELSSSRSSHHGRSATSSSTTSPQVLTGSLGVGGSITDAHEDPERHGMVRRHAAIREQTRSGIHRQSVSSSRSTSPHVQTGSLGVGGSITDAHEDPEWHGMVRYAAVWEHSSRRSHHTRAVSSSSTSPHAQTGFHGVGGSITDAHEDPGGRGMVRRHAAAWVQTNRPQHSCHMRPRQPTTPDQPTNGPTHIGTRPTNHTRPTYTGVRTSRWVTASRDIPSRNHHVDSSIAVAQGHLRERIPLLIYTTPPRRHNRSVSRLSRIGIHGLGGSIAGAHGPPRKLGLMLGLGLAGRITNTPQITQCMPPRHTWRQTPPPATATRIPPLNEGSAIVRTPTLPRPPAPITPPRVDGGTIRSYTRGYKHTTKTTAKPAPHHVIVSRAFVGHQTNILGHQTNILGSHRTN